MPAKERNKQDKVNSGRQQNKFEGDYSTPTTNLLTAKLLFNSIVSTLGAKVLGLDLEDFYFNTPMKRPEYLRMKLAHFPDDVIDHYKLREKVDKKGDVFIKVCKGMYGLPHTGLIAQQLLEKPLKVHGYCQSNTTPGFWRHNTRPICVTLIVDDFGVKYVGKEHADHLIKLLREHYVVEDD